MGLALISVLPLQTQTPTQTGASMGVLNVVILPAVVIIVVGLLSGMLWITNDRGWAVSPVYAIVIPIVAILAHILPIVIFGELTVNQLKELGASSFFWAAALHGAAVVTGAAVKQRQWQYCYFGLLIAVSVGATNLLDPHLPLEGFLYLATAYLSTGLLVGYLTSAPEKQIPGTGE